MSEDERTTYKVITLKGSDNYEDWKLSILSVLLSKDILDFVKTTKATTEAKDKRDVGKCFALIIQSLSPVITSSLPANVRNPLDAEAALLWDHLEKTFSAKVGARQASNLGARTLSHRHSRGRGSNAAPLEASVGPCPA
jgi:hypothetical protein